MLEGRGQTGNGGEFKLAGPLHWTTMCSFNTFEPGGRNMRLENNQQFPKIVARRVGGDQMTIPADLAGSWSVVLFYRGEW